jgi:CoA:oxalate CoA-transferase
VWAAAQACSILSGPIFTVDEVVDDPHYKGRGYWVEIEHPVAGRLRYPGQPFRMSEHPWRLRRPAPLLGQHNEEVYGALGYSKEDLVKLREMGAI